MIYPYWIYTGTRDLVTFASTTATIYPTHDERMIRQRQLIGGIQDKDKKKYADLQRQYHLAQVGHNKKLMKKIQQQMDALITHYI